MFRASPRQAERSRRLDGLRALVRPSRSGTIFFNMGVQWAGASSIMTALNFLVTIITMRAPGMTFWRMPLLVWANFTTPTARRASRLRSSPARSSSSVDPAFTRTSSTSTQGRLRARLPAHLPGSTRTVPSTSLTLPGFRDHLGGDLRSYPERRPIFGYRLMALSLWRSVGVGFSVWRTTCSFRAWCSWLRVPMMVTKRC